LKAGGEKSGNQIRLTLGMGEITLHGRDPLLRKALSAVKQAGRFEIPSVRILDVSFLAVLLDKLGAPFFLASGDVSEGLSRVTR
jgi:hypothetical protein